jgi:hypothetical protein
MMSVMAGLVLAGHDGTEQAGADAENGVRPHDFLGAKSRDCVHRLVIDST